MDDRPIAGRTICAPRGLVIVHMRIVPGIYQWKYEENLFLMFLPGIRVVWSRVELVVRRVLLELHDLHLKTRIPCRVQISYLSRSRG